MSKIVDMATYILDVAQQLIQTRGYNAFSYADIAAQVGIRTATIHYYFPTKADLGRDVIVRYRSSMRAGLAQLDQEETSYAEKLKGYVEMCRRAVDNGTRLCLCVMLMADFETLSDEMRREVEGFDADNVAWLTHILSAGREAGLFRFAGPADVEAQFIFATIEGAELVARGSRNIARFDVATRQLLEELGVKV